MSWSEVSFCRFPEIGLQLITLDPNQLPPTVISEPIVRYQYNESLFVRIAKRDMSNMHLLR